MKRCVDGVETAIDLEAFICWSVGVEPEANVLRARLRAFVDVERERFLKATDGALGAGVGCFSGEVIS